MVASMKRNAQKKKSRTKKHYRDQLVKINGGNEFTSTPLTIWRGSKDNGQWTTVTQLSRVGSITPQRPRKGVRVEAVTGVIAVLDDGNYCHIEEKFIKKTFDNFVVAKEGTNASAKGSNAKQLTGNIDGYVRVQWFSNDEEKWIVPLLIEPISTKKRESNRPNHFVPGGLSNVQSMYLNYIVKRQHERQYHQACKLLGWEQGTFDEDNEEGVCEGKDRNVKMDETTTVQQDTKKDEREDNTSTVSSVSNAMERIHQKPGDQQYTRDLVHLSLIFLVISRKQKCDSISKEFDTTFGIKPCKGEQNSGKYLEWIQSVTKSDSYKTTKRKQTQREMWEK